MRRLIIRILLKALTIMYVFPLLPGVNFHGNLYSAIGLAVFFCLLLSFMELLSAFFAAVLTVSTFGLALLLIWPVRIFFFWLLPTLSLAIIAYFFPSLITIKSWLYAAIAALLLLAIGFITRDRKH